MVAGLEQVVGVPGELLRRRKLHMTYRRHITPQVRTTLADREYDELLDGSHELGIIEWIDYRKTANLLIFPPIGPALAALPDPRGSIGSATSVSGCARAADPRRLKR